MKSKQSFLVISALIISLLGGYSCDTTSPQISEQVPQNLQGHSWKLTSFESVTGSSNVGTSTIYLKFASDTLGGISSSNYYFSPYKAFQDGTINIQTFSATKVGEPKGSKYGEYKEALLTVTHYSIVENNTTLKLYYDDLDKWLKFKRVDKTFDLPFGE